MQASATPKFSIYIFLQTLLQYWKVVAMHMISMVLVAAVIALFTVTGFMSIPGIWIKAIHIILFIGSGVIYALLYQKHLPFLSRYILTEKMFFSLFLSIVICSVLLIFYLLTDKSLVIMAFAGSAAFLLPTIFSQSWLFFTSIPKKEYVIWYNPETDIDNRVPIYLNSISIKLQVALAPTDQLDAVFNLTVPGQTRLGKIFNQFVLVQNKKDPSVIECVDKNRYPFGWQFFVKTGGGLLERRIDPHQNLRQNKVKENSVIIARRVKASMKLEF